MTRTIRMKQIVVKEKSMTRDSRDKLNAIHITGAITFAAVLAAIAQSWVLFVVIAAALIAASVMTGEVRPPRRVRRSRR